MQDILDDDLVEVPGAEDTPPPRRRALLVAKLTLLTVSLSLTAGIAWLGVVHFSFDARTDGSRTSQFKSVQVAGMRSTGSRWTQADDFRALPATFGDWQRTDFIGGPAVSRGFARLRDMLPGADLDPVMSDYSGHNCSAAIYERGDEVLMITIDRGGRKLPRDVEYATRTTLGGVDFVLLGRRGEANINLLAVFDDGVSLSVMGKADPDTVARFVRRARLSVLGVET